MKRKLTIKFVMFALFLVFAACWIWSVWDATIDELRSAEFSLGVGWGSMAAAEALNRGEYDVTVGDLEKRARELREGAKRERTRP